MEWCKRGRGYAKEGGVLKEWGGAKGAELCKGEGSQRNGAVQKGAELCKLGDSKKGSGAKGVGLSKRARASQRNWVRQKGCDYANELGLFKDRLSEEGVAMQMRPHRDRAMYAKGAGLSK